MSSCPGGIFLPTSKAVTGSAGVARMSYASKNAIGPALIDTPMTEVYLAEPGFREQAVAVIPMGRLAEPRDLVATIILLLAEGGAFITGQTIYVDGGRTLV